MEVIEAIDAAYEYGLVNGFMVGVTTVLVVQCIFNWITGNLKSWKPKK